MKKIILIIFLLLLSACMETKSNATPTSTKLDISDNDNASLQLSLKPVFENLSFQNPLAMLQSQNLNWFVVEQKGTVKTFNSIDDTTKPFIDISDNVSFGGEMGLLGMALHPNFDENGIFYLSYTDKNNNSTISRFNSSNLIGDIQSEKNILTVSQPYSNHNGGHIVFGSDGYLYIGLGDGGSSGDPREHGQNIESLLGTILRIDVDIDTHIDTHINSTAPYKIPTDNPFVNLAGKDEIYAYGLRNPWRFSFDKDTHELWLADVGQNEWEEINLIVKGGNYGWNTMEASHCFQQENCDTSTLIAPLYEYPRSKGQSVTGGFIYRGTTITDLIGVYLYADYVSGKIWGLTRNAELTVSNQEFIDSSIYISSFAEDQAGNLYVLGHQSGKIYQIIEKPQP